VLADTAANPLLRGPANEGDRQSSLAASLEQLNERIHDGQAQLRKHMDEVESRILARIVSRSGAAEAPAYHTQQLKDHVDRGFASLKDEVRGWMCDFQTEMLKQFHLAHEDMLDVSDALTKQTAALAATVHQLQRQIEADSETRRRVGNMMP
jgi:hypothetical protein